MSEHFKKNLNELMSSKGISAYFLAKQIGVEYSTVFRWLDEKTKSTPRGRTLVAIGSFFNIDPLRLLADNFSADETKVEIAEKKSYKNKIVKGELIPLTKISQGLSVMSLLGENDIAINDGEIAPPAEEWLPPVPDKDLRSSRLIAVKAVGEAMAPEINDGDIVYIEMDYFEDNKAVEVHNNDIVLADPERPDGEKDKDFPLYPPPVIRKLVYGNDEHDLWLKATNPEWPGTKLLKGSCVLGKVVAIFRRIKP